MSKPTLPALNEQRALEVFDRLPAGHILHLQRINMHAPHLRAGEFAVVDTGDKEIAFGELYLIQQTHGPFIWQVSKAPGHTVAGPGFKHELPCAWLHPLRKIRFEDAVAQANRRGTNILELYLSDGPIFLNALRKQILGRVVGVYQGPDVQAERLIGKGDRQ